MSKFVFKRNNQSLKEKEKNIDDLSKNAYFIFYFLFFFFDSNAQEFTTSNQTEN